MALCAGTNRDILRESQAAGLIKVSTGSPPSSAKQKTWWMHHECQQPKGTLAWSKNNPRSDHFKRTSRACMGIGNDPRHTQKAAVTWPLPQAPQGLQGQGPHDRGRVPVPVTWRSSEISADSHSIRLLRLVTSKDVASLEQCLSCNTWSLPQAMQLMHCGILRPCPLREPRISSPKARRAKFLVRQQCHPKATKAAPTTVACSAGPKCHSHSHRLWSGGCHGWSFSGVSVACGHYVATRPLNFGLALVLKQVKCHGKYDASCMCLRLRCSNSSGG